MAAYRVILGGRLAMVLRYGIVPAQNPGRVRHIGSFSIMLTEHNGSYILSLNFWKWFIEIWQL